MVVSDPSWHNGQVSHLLAPAVHDVVSRYCFTNSWAFTVAFQMSSASASSSQMGCSLRTSYDLMFSYSRLVIILASSCSFSVHASCMAILTLFFPEYLLWWSIYTVICRGQVTFPPQLLDVIHPVSGLWLLHHQLHDNEVTDIDGRWSVAGTMLQKSMQDFVSLRASTGATPDSRCIVEITVDCWRC